MPECNQGVNKKDNKKTVGNTGKKGKKRVVGKRMKKWDVIEGVSKDDGNGGIARLGDSGPVDDHGPKKRKATNDVTDTIVKMEEVVSMMP